MATHDAEERVEPARKGTTIARWLGPAILAIVGIIGIALSVALGVSTEGRPGPGLWPLVVSSVIVICAIAMGPQDDVEAVKSRELRLLASAVLLLGLFTWLFTLMGIFVPTLIVLFVWLKFLAKRGWVFSTITSAVTAAAMYAIFTYVFGVGA